jgi:hypothetical protein
MRRTYRWDAGADVGRIQPGDIALSVRQRKIIGIEDGWLGGKSATIHVSNKPVRGWKEIIFVKLSRDCQSPDVVLGAAWCIPGFKKAGIIPKPGGRLWVKVVEDK